MPDRPDTCSIARAMELLGERWTFLILCEAFWGVRRFSQLQRSLGIARNILSARLQALVAHGILERVRYRSDPDRYEYRLTDRGRDLYPAIVTIMQWGDKHLSGTEGAPLVLRHTCGHDAAPALTCSGCGEPVDPRDITPERAGHAVA